MAKKYLLATLNNMTSIPNGSIYRGVELDDPVFDDKFNQVFKKKGLKLEGRIDINLKSLNEKNNIQAIK